MANAQAKGNGNSGGRAGDFGQELPMTIAEIERAIIELPPQDLTRLREWFDEFYAQMWDKQIERDAAAGRLDKLLAEVDKEYNAGLSAPL